MPVCGTWFKSYRHKHTSNGAVVFTSLVIKSSEKLSCYITPIKMTRFQTQHRERKKNALKLNNLMVFFHPPLHHHYSFISCASNTLSGVSAIRKTSRPRPCRDGLDEARKKTLMFIRQSLSHFHRCQSGKVTVTAPIRENSQNGIKGNKWKPKLGNNTSLTSDSVKRITHWLVH